MQKSRADLWSPSDAKAVRMLPKTVRKWREKGDVAEVTRGSKGANIDQGKQQLTAHVTHRAAAAVQNGAVESGPGSEEGKVTGGPRETFSPVSSRPRLMSPSCFKRSVAEVERPSEDSGRRQRNFWCNAGTSTAACFCFETHPLKKLALDLGLGLVRSSTTSCSLISEIPRKFGF